MLDSTLNNLTMKQTAILLAVLITGKFNSYSQSETKSNILFDGLYLAKTGGVPAVKIEIFTYLRFFAFIGAVNLKPSTIPNAPVACFHQQARRCSRKLIPFVLN